jgi:predicted transposase YdaD
MKTDELFYELFKIDPPSLFRLVQLPLEGTYTFESITVKTTEKRIDGFCKRIDGQGPHVFLEIQGYDDPKIYWRALREVCTYYEQNDDTVPFVLIVLFLDAAYDPGNFPLSEVKPPHQFLTGNLIDCLQRVGEHPGVLTVLKPFVVTRKEQIFDEIQEWKTELRSLPFPAETIHILLGLLEYLIMQRFPKINRKEIESMLHLTPIEETVIGKELIEIGEKKGLQEGLSKGLSKGELIGEIRAIQKILKRPVKPVPMLARKGQKTLKAMLAELEAELMPVE